MPNNCLGQSTTITHVTLKTGGSYGVAFVNPTNYSQVYATSNAFDVKAPGSAFCLSSPWYFDTIFT